MNKDMSEPQQPKAAPTNNQTTDPNYLSDCHNAAVYVVSADEGTNHYECLECKQACNFRPATPTNTIDNKMPQIGQLDELREAVKRFCRSEAAADNLAFFLNKYVAIACNEARVDELRKIPNFEVEDVDGNAARYIVDRLETLTRECDDD